MRLAIAAVVFCLMLIPAGLAHAHRVAVYAYVEGDQIKGEGYMPGGGKVSNQPVQLQDSGGKVLAETKTKQDGSFAMPLPQGKPPFNIVLNAGPGHRATFQLEQSADNEAGKIAEPEKVAPKGEPAVAGIDVAELKTMVRQAVQESLAPVRAQLAEMALHANDVSLRDIIGGLGWIVGILGLALFFKARKMETHR